MRILTGSLRGRVLQFKAKVGLRPTADKVRKAIFDMLQGELEDKKVLDLFSGTGALGLEALSNGAAEVVFIESDKFQAREIRESLEKLGLDPRGCVLQSDAFQAIDKISRDGAAFDFIFMDPPYEQGLALKALERLAAGGVVKKEGIVIAETRVSEELPENVGNLRRIKEKNYGDTRILIYKSSGLLYC